MVCLLVSSGGPLLAQQASYPFRDPNLAAEKRIDNLLSLTTYP